MLGQFNTTKNRLVDCMSAKERLKQITEKVKTREQNPDYMTIKQYILRKEKDKF